MREMPVGNWRLEWRLQSGFQLGKEPELKVCTLNAWYAKSEIALLSTEVKSSATSSLINRRSDL
jgi:hypothetical protein